MEDLQIRERLRRNMAVKGKAAEPPKKTKPTAQVSMKGGATPKPRQGRLPEMEDTKLDELHSLAEDYVDIRDQRIALNKEEKPLKDNLLAAMHKHGKSHYKHNGLEITVVHENEKVKLKLKKDSDDEDE
jgi:hypothetical protein